MNPSPDPADPADPPDPADPVHGLPPGTSPTRAGGQDDGSLTNSLKSNNTGLFAIIGLICSDRPGGFGANSTGLFVIQSHSTRLFILRPNGTGLFALRLDRTQLFYDPAPKSRTLAPKATFARTLVPKSPKVS